MISQNNLKLCYIDPYATHIDQNKINATCSASENIQSAKEKHPTAQNLLEHMQTGNPILSDFPAVADVQKFQTALELMHTSQTPVIKVDTFAEIHVSQVLQLN